MINKIKLGLLYLFVAVSIFIALYIIYAVGLDFFDPNNISFQILNLTHAQIIILDIAEIFIFLTLIAFLVFWVVKKNMNKVILTRISIWIFTLLIFLIENSFRLKVG